MARPKSSSYKYWHDRESEANRKYIRDEKEYSKELLRHYDYALDQIQKEIESFYHKYAKAEGITMSEAKRRISKTDIKEYQRKAKKYSKEKKFTDKANEEMRLYNATMKINRLEMLKAKIGLETVAASSDAEKYMREILQGRTIQEIERQAGILGESIGTNVKDVNSLIDASLKNASWSERIWNNQKLLQTELDKLLNNGLIQGKGSTALARDLRKAFDATKYNAERLMRTELCRVRSDAQLESFKKNGFGEYMYLTLSSAPFTKSKVCEVCKALDGKTFPIKDAEVGLNLPPMHPNCRCSIAAYEDEEEYQKWLDGMASKKHTAAFENNQTDKLKKPRVGSARKKVPKAKDIMGKRFSKKAQKAFSIVQKHLPSKSKWDEKSEIGLRPFKQIVPQSSALPNGNILIKPDTTLHQFIHEMLHMQSCNMQYGSYRNNKAWEEIPVEFMAREICEKERIAYKISNAHESVDNLREINKLAKLYKDDYTFAKELMKEPVQKRKEWLEEKVLSKIDDYSLFVKVQRLIDEVHYGKSYR